MFEDSAYDTHNHKRRLRNKLGRLLLKHIPEEDAEEFVSIIEEMIENASDDLYDLLKDRG